MPNLGGWEWLIMVVVAAVIFAGSRLPGIEKNAKVSNRGFRAGSAAEENGVDLNPTASNLEDHDRKLDEDVS